MTPYTPTSRRQRAALAAGSFVVSLSLMSSVLMLFSDGRLPSSEVEAKAPQRAPQQALLDCAADGPQALACSTRVALGEARARR